MSSLTIMLFKHEEESPGLLDSFVGRLRSLLSPTAAPAGNGAPSAVKSPPPPAPKMHHFNDVPRMSLRDGGAAAGEGLIPSGANWLPAGSIPTLADIWSNIKTIMASVDLWAVFWAGVLGFVSGVVEGVIEEFWIPRIKDEKKRELVKRIINYVTIGLGFVGFAALAVSLCVFLEFIPEF